MGHDLADVRRDRELSRHRDVRQSEHGRHRLRRKRRHRGPEHGRLALHGEELHLRRRCRRRQRGLRVPGLLLGRRARPAGEPTTSARAAVRSPARTGSSPTSAATWRSARHVGGESEAGDRPGAMCQTDASKTGVLGLDRQQRLRWNLVLRARGGRARGARARLLPGRLLSQRHGDTRRLSRPRPARSSRP